MIHELMAGCPWAQNRSKLERAIREVRGDSQETGEIGKKKVTEEAVKKVYIRLLGNVIDVKAAEPEETPSEENTKTPRRRGRPVKE